MRSDRIHQSFREFLGVRGYERTAPKAAVFAAWFVLFNGSDVLFLSVGQRYVLLDGELYFWCLAAVPLCLLISYFIPLRTIADLKHYPLWANVAGRLGFCLPGVFLLIVAFLGVNGATDHSSYTQIVPCLGHRATTGKQTHYYARIRPWVGSAKDVEVNVTRSDYEYLESVRGAVVQLTTGRGRLGLEWIRELKVLPPSA